MVGYENADILIFESPNDVLNLLHGDRVHTGERFVQHYEFRFDSETTGNLCTASFSSAQPVAQILAHMRQVEFFNQLLQFLLLIFLAEIGQFQYGADIIFHGHFAEYTRLLRQIADTHLGAFVHRETRDVLVIEEDTAVIRGYKTGRHIECGGLAGAVGS